MSRLIRALAALGCSASLILSAAQAQPVTTEMLEEAQSLSDRWIHYGKNYGAWRHMPDEQINRDTVHRLAPRWMYQAGISGGALQVSALVHDGRMYLTTANSHLVVVDPLTGTELWRYDHEFSDVDLCCGPHNRGVALYEDMVLWGTLDARLMAFDAETGVQLWDTEVADHRASFSITAAPLVVKDMVLIGVGGGEFGIRGFIDAYNVHTGEHIWRFYTVPGEGEPGNETWAGDSWKTGGAPTWVTGTYDPELDMIYWGTGNPWPDLNNRVREGDNLYANSVVALDADTGELIWYLQESPRDEFDHDATSEPMIIDGLVDGELRKMIIHVGRNGHVYAMDRVTGEFLWAEEYTRVNWAYRDEHGMPTLKPELYDPADTVVFPGLFGGKNWPPAAYNPDTGMIYIPEHERGTRFVRAERPGRPGTMDLGGIPIFEQEAKGHIVAFDIHNREIAWKFETPGGPNWAGTLSTGGGLVFGGAPDGYLRAFNSETGEVLWQFQTGSGIYAPPTSWTIDGRQFIGVAAGWRQPAVRDGVGAGNTPGTYIVFELFGE